MRWKRNVNAVMLLVCSIACATKTGRPTKPPQPERYQHAVYDKHPLDTRIREERAEQRGEDLREREKLVVGALAYPGTEVDPKQRLRAFARLEENRRALGRRKVRGGWLDPHRQGPGSGPGGGTGGGPGTPGTTDASGCAWRSAGPTNINGRVTDIAIDPTNRDRIYLTTVGGIWRSTDRGRRWQRVSDDFLATVFGSVAVNPTTPTEVLIGGGEPNYQFPSSVAALGIFRSTSSGDPGTWTKISPAELDGHIIYKLRFDPTAPNEVYAATSAGVYLGTRSGGGTITFARLGAFDAWTADMAVDFTATPRVVYAAVREASATRARGIWKWNGTSWSKRDGGIDTANGHTIAIGLARSAPATLYAKVEALNGRLLGVYKTTTGGEPPAGGGTAWTAMPSAMIMDDARWDWSDPNSPGYSWYNSIIQVDPTNANVVYAGGLGSFRTTDGSTWTEVSDGDDPGYPYWVHGDQHAVAFDPVDPHIVYIGNDGGIDVSTDSSLPVWHWNDISHGMVITEFYYVSSHQATATLMSGGTQDNGTDVTFGNRTWYNPGGCDGYDVAVDAQNPETIYANCNGGLYEIAQPVPGAVSPPPPNIVWSSPSATPAPPVATDETTAGRAMLAGTSPCNPQRLLTTTDGVNWSAAGPALPAGAAITAVAAAPSSSFQTYYVGVIYRPPSLTDCPGFSGTAFPAKIYRTTDAGATPWLSANVGLPDLYPVSFAVDTTNASRAFVAMSGSPDGAVAITTDGGANWTTLPGSGATSLPVGAAYRAVAIDPSDPNVIYAASNVGVFRGTITTPGGGAPVASWIPFDEGLPDGLNVNDIWVNRATGVLSIGTMGHGLYVRDIRPGVTCPARMLLVRDNIHDRGVVPSPSGVPDPEHPIPDPARPGFFKPNDTAAGRTYWWTSNDIRIDVPSADPAKNTFASVDHVEFESCPTLLSDCPAGTMRDSEARRGRPARAYVQVANQGLQPVTNVRVIALWTDATTTVPDLPANFWTTTFPAGSTACGTLDTSSGWNLVDSATPCRTVPVVNPDLPEVVGFNWAVPMSAPEHSCMLTIVESADDPIDPALRGERRMWVLVPQTRHVAQRNLHVVDAPPGSAPSMGAPMWIVNPTDLAGIELYVAQPKLKSPIRFFFPAGFSAGQSRGVRRVDARLTDEQIRTARELKVDPAVAYEVSEQEAVFFLPLAPHERMRVMVTAESAGEPNTSARLDIVAKQGTTVLGGNVYILRHPPRQSPAVKDTPRY